MAKDDWFYEIEGEERGPVSFEDLRALVDRGKLEPGDLVWADGMDDWAPARSIDGLVPRALRERARERDEAPEPGGTPGLVIAGFICSFLCPLLGLILCAVGYGAAKRRRAGEGLAVAGIVIGAMFGLVVPVIAAIAIPNLLEARKSANESAAISSLRSLVTVQQLYRDADKDGNGLTDYASSLSALASVEPPLIDPLLATGQKQGYVFELEADARGSRWSCRARPQSPKTGARHFYVDDTGVIRFEIDRPAGPTSRAVGG